jgi:hypothetical protein
MFRVLKADRDSYITNKYVNGISAVSGNVGIAGSLDLFKLFGVTTVAGISQTELSRLLLHFNLDPLRELVDAGKIDISNNSFKCFISLKDVYGGQPTPNNFTVDVFPMSSSFTEGFGKDTAYYLDEDKCNFLSSSVDSPWYGKGCSVACFSTGSGDYITSSISIIDTKASQYFKTGEEDLLVDVTKIISATLTNELPDEGFRISYNSSIEQDSHTYFVKRFASRHAYDESKHPKLLVKFDDSISDDTSDLYLDTNSTIFLYNYTHGQLSNLISGSSVVTGQNCLLLELKTQTPISGSGIYSLYFTGSQHSIGANFVNGIYSASISLPLSDPGIKNHYQASGSIKFTPIWGSLDGTVAYVTGSTIVAKGPERITKRLSPRRYVVNALGISNQHSENEEITIRVNIFDENSPIIIAKRLPVELPGVVLRNVYYAIRNSTTNEYVIPFDVDANSTKVSSDSSGMYFNLHTSALTSLNSYVVDIMIVVDGAQQKYLNASPVFKITKL